MCKNFESLNIIFVTIGNFRHELVDIVSQSQQLQKTKFGECQKRLTAYVRAYFSRWALKFLVTISNVSLLYSEIIWNYAKFAAPFQKYCIGHMMAIDDLKDGDVEVQRIVRSTNQRVRFNLLAKLFDFYIDQHYIAIDLHGYSVRVGSDNE